MPRRVHANRGRPNRTFLLLIRNFDLDENKILQISSRFSAGSNTGGKNIRTKEPITEHLS